MSGLSDSQESFSPSGEKNTQATISPEQVDLGQVYTLIDGILPFEACLYYQILPLSIEGSRLLIGTVNPDDRAASDYVKKQLSYINYSLSFRIIQSDWHRDLLSKYLSHNAKTRQRPQRQSTHPAQAEAKDEKPASKPLNDPGSQATFIVDQPDEIPDFVQSAPPRLSKSRLAEGLEDTLPTAPEIPSASPAIDELTGEVLTDEEAPTLISVPTSNLPEVMEALPVEETPTIISAESIVEAPQIASESPISSPAIAQKLPAKAPEPDAPSRPIEAPAAPPTLSRSSVPEPVVSSRASVPESGAPTNLPSSLQEDEQPLELQIDAQYCHPLNEIQLAALPPKALMQALLGQVLGEGIGRLYFERPGNTGRILWSKDGILQAVLESIDPQVFQGVINEFKLLTHLSLALVKKPKQVEIERLYEGERILLRFRVMPNAYGEEATLQVLRGTALRFYQQQQIDKLGRDALDAAQALNRRLNEIRDRARQTLNFKATRSETLPAIIQLLKQMESQVQELVSEYGSTKDRRPKPSRRHIKR